MSIVMPGDNFAVINKTILYDNDRKILTMLYQPIVGSTAISLYFTLWSYLDSYEIISNDLTYRHLMKSTGLNIDKIMEAREKLEAIGLIKTYVNETTDVNNYLFELYSPMRPNDFINDPILSTLLHDTVGKKEYHDIIAYFKIPNINLSKYKDISSKFSDVFKIININDIEDIEEVKRENRLGIAFEPKIDLNNILSLIPEQMLNIKSVNNEIKDLIHKLAIVYNYDDEMMMKVITNSIDASHKIDAEKLKENARKLYKFENSNGNVSALYNNQPEYLKTKLKGTSMKEKMIYRYETESPYDFLASKDGVEISAVETDILKMLIVDIGLKPGVVNVLIDYVLKTSENKLVKSFIENKALEWKRNNIETVVDAIEAGKKDRKRRNSTKETKTVTKVPTWMNKELDSSEASAEEEKAFREKLKNMG